MQFDVYNVRVHQAGMDQVISVLGVARSPCPTVVTIYLLLRYFLILTTDFYQVFAHLNENIISGTFLPLDTAFLGTRDYGYDNFIARRLLPASLPTLPLYLCPTRMLQNEHEATGEPFL